MKNIVFLLLMCICLTADVVNDRSSINGHRVVVKLDVIDAEVTQKTELYFKIDYQGLLEDKDGRMIADGNYIVTYRIYDSEESGESVWKEAFPRFQNGSDAVREYLYLRRTTEYSRG